MTQGEPRVLHKQDVRLNDLADAEGYISNLLVQDCTVYGPAVVVFGGVNFTGCTFDPDAESVLWPVQRGRATVTGALMFRNCSFENCRFVGVGLAVPEDDVPGFLAS